MLSYRPFAAAFIAVAAAAAPAVEAGPRADDAGLVVASLGPGARVDWTRGLLIATGAAAADLRAASPELARFAAERQAREAARRRLRQLARGLDLAGGRELGAALTGAAAERFDRALDAVLDERIDHASDGSVVLAAALPLEAVRAALFGPSPPAAAKTERGPTAIVVEAGRHLKRPAVGVKLAAGGERYGGPTVFAVRADELGAERLGARPLRVRARGYRGGALQLAGDDAGHLAEARAAGALVVVELAGYRPGRADKARPRSGVKHDENDESRSDEDESRQGR